MIPQQRKPWSAEDKARLVLAVQRGGFPAAFPLFPDRTHNQIRSMYHYVVQKPGTLCREPATDEDEDAAAAVLAEKRSLELADTVRPNQPLLEAPAVFSNVRRWTSEEDDALIDAHIRFGFKNINEIFPYRTPAALRRRLNELRQEGRDIPYERVPRGRQPALEEPAQIEPPAAVEAAQAAYTPRPSLLRAKTPVPAPEVPPEPPKWPKAPEIVTPRPQATILLNNMEFRPLFDCKKSGLTSYVQRNSFADAYEFIRKRMLYDMDALAEQLNLPTVVVARAIQVMSATDFKPASLIQPAKPLIG